MMDPLLIVHQCSPVLIRGIILNAAMHERAAGKRWVRESHICYAVASRLLATLADILGSKLDFDIPVHDLNLDGSNS